MKFFDFGKYCPGVFDFIYYVQLMTLNRALLDRGMKGFIMNKKQMNKIMKAIKVVAVKAAYTCVYNDAVKAVKIIKKTLKCSKDKAANIYIDVADNAFCSIEHDGSRISGFEVLRDPEYSRYCGCAYDSILTDYYFRD